MSSSASAPAADPSSKGTADAGAIIEAIKAAELDRDLSQGSNPADHQLPELDLPGFGEPLEDCGDLVPEAMHYCTDCYDVKEFPRNCYRYDCPDHAPYAIRRRAAGSSSMPGAVAKISSTRAYLDSIKNQDQYFHHLSISPPEGFYFKSADALERAFQLIGEILEEFGVEGLVEYHPYRGVDGDDRGAWKERLFHKRDWSDVQAELSYSPHFHINCAGIVDVSVAEAVEEKTGWVIKRITGENSSVSNYGNAELARSTTYALSHAGIYETESGQRRLAARWKGPNISEIHVGEKWKKKLAGIVNTVAEDTLGIDAPDLECDERYPTKSGSPGDGEWSFSPARSSGSSSGAPPDLSGDPGSGSPAKVNVEPCGGRLRHISTAGEVLPELVQIGADVDTLDAAYRSYVDVMKAKGRRLDDRPEIPEFHDRPPNE